MSLTVFFLNGPNLNLLGEREPDIYGRETLDDLKAIVIAAAKSEGAKSEFRQSNHEGELIDWIHEAKSKADALVINAGAYTHTSVAIHDALKALTIPIVEVHLSNPATREPFRRKSYVALCASGVIAGFGSIGYRLGVTAALALARQRS